MLPFLGVGGHSWRQGFRTEVSPGRSRVPEGHSGWGGGWTDMWDRSLGTDLGAASS